MARHGVQITQPLGWPIRLEGEGPEEERTPAEYWDLTIYCPSVTDARPTFGLTTAQPSQCRDEEQRLSDDPASTVPAQLATTEAGADSNRVAEGGLGEDSPIRAARSKIPQRAPSRLAAEEA